MFYKTVINSIGELKTSLVRLEPCTLDIHCFCGNSGGGGRKDDGRWKAWGRSVAGRVSDSSIVYYIRKENVNINKSTWEMYAVDRNFHNLFCPLIIDPSSGMVWSNPRSFSVFNTSRVRYSMSSCAVPS